MKNTTKYPITLMLIVITLLTFSASCNGKQEDNSSTGNEIEKMVVPTQTTKIEFTFTGIDIGMAKLIGVFSEQWFQADSVIVNEGGKLVLERDSIYPEGYYYFILPGNKTFVFLLDEDQHFKISADTANLDETAQVEGSSCNALFFMNKRFQNKISEKTRPFTSKMAKLSPITDEFKKAEAENNKFQNEYKEHLDWIVVNYPDNLFTKFKIGGQNPILTYPVTPDGKLDTKMQVYSYRNAFWDGFDFNEEALIRTPVFSNKLKRYFTELIPLNQDSIIKYADLLIEKIGDNKEYYKIVTNWITIKFEPGHTKLMDGAAVYVHMVQNYFTTEKAFWAIPDQIKGLQDRAIEMEQSLIGKQAGNVTARGYDGKMYTFFDTKAPIIVIFIYTPNCDHCHEQTPELIEFYEEWKAKGVEVYSIAANTNQKDWDEFHTEFDIPWVDVFDKTNASWYPKYFVDVTPELYLIDKDRKIVAKNLKVGQLEKSISRMNK